MFMVLTIRLDRIESRLPPKPKPDWHFTRYAQYGGDTIRLFDYNYRGEFSPYGREATEMEKRAFEDGVDQGYRWRDSILRTDTTRTKLNWGGK
jgi:hypothetical protein